MAVYITREELDQRFGEEQIAELLDDDADGTESAEETDTLDQAILDAGGVIDGYVGVRYTLPLTEPVPSLVVNWAADITRFKLYESKAPEEVRQRYDDAIAQLKDLAKGLLNLPIVIDVAISGASGIDGFSNCRLFTEETLADF
jgi:phage gp36-like protein